MSLAGDDSAILERSLSKRSSDETAEKRLENEEIIRFILLIIICIKLFIHLIYTIFPIREHTEYQLI